MNVRTTILIMSAFGVISDSILIGFYPQFFEQRYGMTSPVHVGAYIAAISIAVMCMLPLWARVARHVETLHLLLWTQGAAALLCLAASFAPTVESYWALTMLMFMTKASYLLLFPYLMRLEQPQDHTLVVGMLSVVIHLGAIFGAAVGGPVLQTLGPQVCVWLMAAGDFAQLGLCLYLIRSGRMVRVLIREGERTPPPAPRSPRAWAALLKLSLIMLLFDFAAYLVRPFFTLYWEDVSGLHDPLFTGLIFAIPGIVALVALGLKRGLARPPAWFDHTLGNLLLGAVGLALQGASEPWLVILGRCLYGWSLYQVAVKLEVTLFKVSVPESYARDFSVTNFFQNLGVLLSSFGAGYVVSLVGIPLTFLLAAMGLVLTALLDRLAFGVDRHHRPATGDLGHAT